MDQQTSNEEAKKLWLKAEGAGLYDAIKRKGLNPNIQGDSVEDWFKDNPEYAGKRDILSLGSQLVQEQRLARLERIQFSGKVVTTDGKQENVISFTKGQREIER